MCVTISQFVGYLIPSKKIQIKKNNIDNYKEIFKGFETWDLNDNQTIYIIRVNESICECGDENGNGREFERNTFKPLIYDEDDMELCEEIKNNLFSKLEQVGLDKYAIYGIYTDTVIDNH